MLLVGSVLAWLLADRVLRPVKAVTETARVHLRRATSAGGSPVLGHDEIAVSRGNLQRHARPSGDGVRDSSGASSTTPATSCARRSRSSEGTSSFWRRSGATGGQTLALVMDELDRMSADRQRPSDAGEVGAAGLPRRPRPSTSAPSSDDVRAKATALGAARTGGSIPRTQRDRRRPAAPHPGARCSSRRTRAAHRGEATRSGSAGVRGRQRGAASGCATRAPGSRSSEQQRVFDRFYRAGESRRVRGAGLGLSIVQAIARAHGGRLDLSSVPGFGATFTIVLPASAAASTARRSDE